MATFNIADFIKFIEEQGYNVEWEPSIVCECIQNGQPDMHCPLCKGQGWRYLPIRSIKGFTQSFTGNLDLAVQGLREPGTAYITPQLGIIMGYHDRLTFPEITCKYSQTLTMGDQKTTSSYRRMEQVLFVVQDQAVYEEEIDFVITEDRCHLQWISSTTKPNKGSKISVLYETNPSYLVMDMVHELRSTRIHKDTRVPYTEELPKQYLIKREDFIYGHTVNAKLEEVGREGELTYE